MSIEERMVFLWKGGRFEGDIVKFTATCKFLTPECKCLIYEDRPQYCKDYYCKESK
jgi:Fe-S-cluster containining protein